MQLSGGLKREWLTLVNKELFNPETGLFEITKNGTNIQLSPMSKIVFSHLKYLELAGMMLAKVVIFIIIS